MPACSFLYNNGILIGTSTNYFRIYVWLGLLFLCSSTDIFSAHQTDKACGVARITNIFAFINAHLLVGGIMWKSIQKARLLTIMFTGFVFVNLLISISIYTNARIKQAPCVLGAGSGQGTVGGLAEPVFFAFQWTAFILFFLAAIVSPIMKSGCEASEETCEEACEDACEVDTSGACYQNYCF